MSDTGRNPDDILVEQTDDRWLAHWPEFVDLQVSEHARGDTEDEARRNLLTPRRPPTICRRPRPRRDPEPQPM